MRLTVEHARSQAPGAEEDRGRLNESARVTLGTLGSPLACIVVSRTELLKMGDLINGEDVFEDVVYLKGGYAIVPGPEETRGGRENGPEKENLVA